VAEKLLFDSTAYLGDTVKESMERQIARLASNKVDVLWQLIVEEFNKQEGLKDAARTKVKDLRYSGTWKKSAHFSKVNLDKIAKLIQANPEDNSYEIYKKYFL
jgi:hypothetical protein